MQCNIKWDGYAVRVCVHNWLRTNASDRIRYCFPQYYLLLSCSVHDVWCVLMCACVEEFFTFSNAVVDSYLMFNTFVSSYTATVWSMSNDSTIGRCIHLFRVSVCSCFFSPFATESYEHIVHRETSKVQWQRTQPFKPLSLRLSRFRKLDSVLVKCHVAAPTSQSLCWVNTQSAGYCCRCDMGFGAQTA